MKNVGGDAPPGGFRLRVVTTLVTAPSGRTKKPSPFRNRLLFGSLDPKKTFRIVTVCPAITCDPEFGEITGVDPMAFPNCASALSVGSRVISPTKAGTHTEAANRLRVNLGLKLDSSLHFVFIILAPSFFTLLLFAFRVSRFA